jgi:hypothetical protein
MVLSVAKAAERCGCFEPGDWPDVAVGMLLEGNEDPEIAELAGLGRRVKGGTPNRWWPPCASGTGYQPPARASRRISWPG